jgi:hypothetical protein
VTSSQYGSCDDGAGKYLEGKLWAEKGGGDSVAEDGLSWHVQPEVLDIEYLNVVAFE